MSPAGAAPLELTTIVAAPLGLTVSGNTVFMKTTESAMMVTVAGVVSAAPRNIPVEIELSWRLMLVAALPGPSTP
jgi:hypothetical protein